jgi:hypothetical protein
LLLLPALFLAGKAEASAVSSAQALGAMGTTNGLVGWWTFDSGYVTGSQVRDKSLYANHGTLTSMSKVQGKIGQALSSNASWSAISASQYVAVPDSASLRLGSTLTISAWFKTSGNAAGEMSILRKDTLNNAPNRYLWGLLMNTNNTVSAEYYNGTDFFSTSAGAYGDNQWHHAVETINGTTITLYIDGIAQTPTTITGSQNAPDGELDIAADGPWGPGGVNARGYNFNGSIDDVRIYSRALSASEIKALYQLGTSKITASPTKVSAQSTTNGLVGWWTFDTPDSGSTYTIDKTGNGHMFTTQSGTNCTPQFVTAKISRGISLTPTATTNGQKCYLLGANNSGISGNASITLSQWVKLRDTTTSGAGLFTGDRNGGAGAAIGTFFNLRGAGAVSVEYASGNSVATAAGALTANKWYLVTIVKSPGAANTTTQIYVNGVLQAISGTPTTVTPNITNSVYYFGVFGNAESDGIFSGQADDMRVYDRALSANEVYSLYTLGGAKVTASPALVSAQSTTNGLVGWWTFDAVDRTTGVMLDKSGNGKNGTVTGTSIIAGKIGQGLYFPKNGANNTVNLGNNFGPTNANSWTYSAWFNRGQVPGATAYFILGKYSAGSAVLMGDSGGTQMYCSLRVAATIASPAVSNVYKDGKWHHMVCVKTNSAQYLYIDGRLVGSDNKNLGGVYNDGGVNMYIGDYGAPAEPWKGGIDDVRIYNRELSANEIYSLYMYGK